MAKPGTEYELFVKEVYEQLNRVDGLEDVEIQHDVKLTGASGVARQIDIYWTFKAAGIPYQVAVECKDYNKRVSIDKISAFHDVLNDIGGIHGIFASKMGFQSGAAEYARTYNIGLMEIRHPIEKDWDGRVKDIHLQIHAYSLDHVHTQIVVDRERAVQMGMSESELQSGFHADPELMTVSYDSITHERGSTSEPGCVTMQELLNMLPREKAAAVGKEYRFYFENGLLQHGDEVRFPIREILFNYDVTESVMNRHILGEEQIVAIVKNITDGTESIIDRFGRVSERSSLKQNRENGIS